MRNQLRALILTVAVAMIVTSGLSESSAYLSLGGGWTGSGCIAGGGTPIGPPPVGPLNAQQAALRAQVMDDVVNIDVKDSVITHLIANPEFAGKTYITFGVNATTETWNTSHHFEYHVGSATIFFDDFTYYIIDGDYNGS